MFAGKKSAQIREILINESAWEEMTCLFALSLDKIYSPRNLHGWGKRYKDEPKTVDSTVLHNTEISRFNEDIHIVRRANSP